MLPTRLARRISVVASGCWEWTGAIDRCGYGQVSIDGGMTVAHRVVFAALRGAIPDGRELDHLCRNRRCVNPDHLEPVDHRTNTLRGTSPPAIHAAATQCPQGHAYDEKNTLVLKNGWRKCLECKRRRAREYQQRKKGLQPCLAMR